MKKLFLPLLLLAIPAFGQGAYYQNNAFTASYINGTHVVTVLDGTSVEICTTVTGACTKVPIFSDQALTVTAQNPVPVDAGGNFGFFVAPGTYSYWVLDSVGTPLIQLPFTTGGGASAAGITALTGDVTASGTGSVAATLATVNSEPGSCGDATHVCQITTNAKGLTTSQAAIAITPGMSGVSSLNSLTGALNIVGGTNISVTPSGSSITVASTAAAPLSGQTNGYLPKANSATTSNGPSIISDDGVNATVHGGVIAGNVTDSVLIAGNCVQATTGGLLGTSGAPCLTADAVSSVFGRTGAVVAATGDYTVAQVTGAAPSASPTFTGKITFDTGVPVLSGCAGGTLAAGSSNNAFHITGLTGTACVATFSAAIAHGVCTANAWNGTTPETVIPPATTTAVTFTVPSGTTDISAICF